MTWRCGRAASWLPHALAAAVLAAAVIASTPGPDDPRGSSLLRPLTVAVGAGLALWLLRRGSVLRRAVTVGDRGLTIAIGARERTLEYRDVVGLDARIPFEANLQWVPTLAVSDVFEQTWEIPMALEGGPAMLDAFLERCARDDLRTWADARRIRSRLERARWFVPATYAVAVVLVVGAWWVQTR